MTLSAIMVPHGFALTPAQKREQERLRNIRDRDITGVFRMFGSPLLTAMKYIPLVGSYVAYDQWKSATMALNLISEIEKLKRRQNNSLLDNSEEKVVYASIAQPTDRATLVIYKIRLFMEILGLGLLFLPLDLVVTGGRAIVALYQRVAEIQSVNKIITRSNIA